MEIQNVSTLYELKTIEQFVADIWRECYAHILQEAQIAYMLDRFLRAEFMFEQVQKKSAAYYVCTIEDIPVAFFATQFAKNDLRIDKLYVTKEYRNKGITKTILAFLKTSREDIHSFSLMVNKYNQPAIAAYQKLGFQIVDSLVTDIGNNYIMDDYKMELRRV